MAAPTKKEREKRQKIKDLKLFVRDSSMYTNCEEQIEVYGKIQAPYIFCELCRIRSDRFKFSSIVENNYIVEKLKDIDLDLSRYFNKVHTMGINTLSFLSEIRMNEGEYSISTEVAIKDIVSALGEVKYKTIVNKGYEFFNDMNTTLELEQIHKHINMEDKKLLLSTLSLSDDSPHTIIKNNKRWDRICDLENIELEKESLVTSNVHVEIDFTKSKEELIEYITMIKDDFDKNPKKIQNIYGLLNNNENYICNLKECDVYKSNHTKPISGRLADVLFIYDCKRAGLNNDYIIDEINKYWVETRNLFKDEFQLQTLREYHSLAIDYIDNEKYKCYLSGYDTTKENNPSS